MYEPETGYNIIMSTVHEEDKPHLCYYDKSYNTMNSLKKHVNWFMKSPLITNNL